MRAVFVFSHKISKNSIILRIILYKRKKCKNGGLSYGYVVDMVWISYGMGPMRYR